MMREDPLAELKALYAKAYAMYWDMIYKARFNGAIWMLSADEVEMRFVQMELMEEE